MRVLVERTRDKAKIWLENLGMMARDGSGDAYPVEDWATDHGAKENRIPIRCLWVAKIETSETHTWRGTG
jgi:hypothetical protein